MVKLKGPSLSLGATGALAGTLVFSTNKGRSYVKKLTKPKQPRTIYQLGQRALTRYLTQLWTTLTPATQANWLAAADPPDESPYHAFIRITLDNWTNFQVPSSAYPITRIYPACTGMTLTATARRRTVLLVPSFTLINLNAGYLLFRNPSPAIPPRKENCIEAAVLTSTIEQDLVDGPLEPGTYYYRALPFSLDGLIGTPSGTVSAVIP